MYLRAFVLLAAKEFSELAKVLAFVPLGILTFLVPAPDTRLIVLELSWLYIKWGKKDFRHGMTCKQQRIERMKDGGGSWI